jgi:hypothetical protein
MADSKDRTDVSQDNILKPNVENLSADEQQQYKDLMSQLKEDAHRQLTQGPREGEGEVLSTLHGGSPPEDYQAWRVRDPSLLI